MVPTAVCLFPFLVPEQSKTAAKINDRLTVVTGCTNAKTPCLKERAHSREQA